tara:strand:+ start:2289 stop:2765 length:477 start_codon:yes stop_codon:yes gene_type:complete
MTSNKASDSPGGRRRGRPARPGDPVTVVSISCPASLLAAIDEERRNYSTHRGNRSSWVRWVLRSYIKLKKREREEKSAFAEVDSFLKGIDEDPTHGGLFDPAQAGKGTWDCPACDCPPQVTGWKYCPGCNHPRGNAPTIPYPGTGGRAASSGNGGVGE